LVKPFPIKKKIGNSYLVGNPAKLLFQHLNATTTTCHEFTRTENLREECRNADIIITATGIRGLINGNDVKRGALVIDVGTNVDEAGKCWGDFDPSVSDHGEFTYTPVPGGIGPLTVTMLLRNLFVCWRKTNQLRLNKPNFVGSLMQSNVEFL
jgi:methylenetetrahydrofolate dehydrogenase (NADP+)/methenyltetrahydrofolate cyclohydrolase